ncbi:MAG: lipid-transfer protein [Actinomycetota bacterium]|nr:lipid-transfer protein [Actinomycetota bacterium]
MVRDAAAIVGIGQTAFGKQLSEPEPELAATAVLAALRDAGIEPSDVDGLCSFTSETTEEVALAKTIGAGDITFFSQVGYGGGAGCATVGHAAMAVATKQADVVVAWRSRKRGARGSRPWAAAPARLPIPGQWTRPFGLLRPVDEVAMLTRRYMHEYGATRRALGEVATAVRSHAERNPLALMSGKPMTMDDYMNARWISEPLCLFDNCLETDGALAVVVVGADRAADCPHPPAYIHAFAQGLPRQHESMVNYFCEDPLTGPAWACAAKLWARSELGPEDIDVAQIYDAFTPLILLSLEGYGFCGRGEAPDFVADGGLRWDGGRLPVNTSGGGLSEAYVHGYNLITEGVRQIRGTSTSQVPDARACLVTSGEGVPTSALVLRG